MILIYSLNQQTKKEFSEKKIKILSIANESLLVAWKNHVAENGYDLIPQYFKSDLFDSIGIKTLPCCLIINRLGLVSYVGNPKLLDIKQSLISLNEGKDLVYLKTESEGGSEDHTQNLWFEDLDEQTKADIILNTNISLKHTGINNISFTTLTKRIYNSDKTIVKVSPIFSGLVTTEGFEILQTFAITLENDFNFKNFQFNMRVLSTGGYDYY